MLDDFPGARAIVAALAVAPSLLRWWWGRTLARHLDDPALPERLMETGRRDTVAVIVTIVLMASVSPRSVTWGLPLLVAGQFVAVYPLRRALYEETWTLPAYLWFFTRLMVVAYGFWIALAALPLMVQFAGRFAWAAGVLLGAILIAWNRWSAEILRGVFRAEPIPDAGLRVRFEDLAARSTVVAPRFEQVRLRGGMIANAIALASPEAPTVLFSETLLLRLPADESVAICAHELAHLEHFDRAWLRRQHAVNVALIVTGAALAPVGRAARLSDITIPLIVWFAALVLALAWRAKDRQKNETASDLRAVELTGDAEALVRGLTTLYTLARVPRRFAARDDRDATHPSLARRIRDIRKAAGIVPATPIAGATFTAPDGRTTVTFEAERVHWIEAPGVTHSLSYAHLSELRLRARLSGPTILVAVAHGSRQWEMPIGAPDVARVQAVLDAVDFRLPDPAPRPRLAFGGVTRVVMALIGLLGMSVGQLAMLVVAVIAGLQPAAPLLAAAGAGSLTAAALLLRDRPAWCEDYAVLAAATLGALGVVLIAMAIAKRSEERPRAVTVLITVLGITTAAAVALVAASGLDAVHLHQSARTITSATILLLALAGALACCRVRTLQYASAGIMLAGAGTAAAGSPAFLDRFADDFFIRAAEPVSWTTLSHGATREFPVPFFASQLRLSPRGGYVAIVPADERGDHEASTFHVGAAGRPLMPLTAADFVFIDDDFALVMDARGTGVEVREVALARSLAAVWRTDVDDIVASHLSFRRATGRWRLFGRDREGRIVRAEGTRGGGSVEYTRWRAPDVSRGWLHATSASGAHALVVETRIDAGMLQRTSLAPLAWIVSRFGTESHFWMLGQPAPVDAGVSRLPVDCSDGSTDDDRLVCTAFDGTRTRVATIDPVGGKMMPVAWLHGHFIRFDRDGAGWVSGWADSTPIALHLASRTALRFPREQSIVHVTASDAALATVAYKGGGESMVRIYPVVW